MAIQCVSKRNGSFRHHQNSSWIGVCDKCGAKSLKKSNDPGVISESLYKEGWNTISTGIRENPLMWHCFKCCQENKKS